MYIKLLSLLLCGVLCLTLGCAAGYSDSPASQTAVAGEAREADPVPPSGMRLGAMYMSALNEPCYELYPISGELAQPQAYCRRNGSWDVIPAIFENVPSGYDGTYSLLMTPPICG